METIKISRLVSGDSGTMYTISLDDHNELITIEDYLNSNEIHISYEDFEDIVDVIKQIRDQLG